MFTSKLFIYVYIYIYFGSYTQRIVIVLCFRLKSYLNRYIGNLTSLQIEPFADIVQSWLIASSSAMLKGVDSCYPFSAGDAGVFRQKIYNCLFQIFFPGIEVSKTFVAVAKTSLYNVFQESKAVFLKRCFVETSHVQVDLNDTGVPLFLLLENCYDVSSVKMLLNILIACYNNLHQEDSVKLNISHTKIINSNVIFIDGCDFINVSAKLVSINQNNR